MGGRPPKSGERQGTESSSRLGGGEPPTELDARLAASRTRREHSAVVLSQLICDPWSW